MNSFHVFLWCESNASGGLNDYWGSAPTLKEAKEKLLSTTGDAFYNVNVGMVAYTDEDGDLMQACTWTRAAGFSEEQ